jgi:hypothetical protein
VSEKFYDKEKYEHTTYIYIYIYIYIGGGERTVISSLIITSLLENVSLRVPTCNIKDFLVSGICPSNKHYPSAPCACAANVVPKDIDIFAIRAASPNHIL